MQFLILCIIVILSWSSQNFIIFAVVPIKCEPLPTYEGGSFTSGVFFAGSVSELSCDLPFRITGNSTYRCDHTGRWRGLGTCCEWNINLLK